MKKIILMVLTLLLVPYVASAKETAYYTNLNGAQLTEQQYNNLIKAIDKDTIATMTPQMIDRMKNDENLIKVEKTKYIITDELYDYQNNLIFNFEKEITGEEAEKFLKNKNSDIMPMGSSHTTSMKKITISIAMGTLSTKLVTVTNEWLILPKTRSFDVIATRPDAENFIITLNSSSISAYQTWDNNIISYNSSSDNTKIEAGNNLTLGSGGVGVSMNIVNDVSNSLKNSLSVQFISGAFPFTAYGTYQHAQSDVTLSQSKNYTFSENGYGKVLKFASSVASAYDQMAGVDITVNSALG